MEMGVRIRTRSSAARAAPRSNGNGSSNSNSFKRRAGRATQQWKWEFEFELVQAPRGPRHAAMEKGVRIRTRFFVWERAIAPLPQRASLRAELKFAVRRRVNPPLALGARCDAEGCDGRERNRDHQKISRTRIGH